MSLQVHIFSDVTILNVFFKYFLYIYLVTFIYAQDSTTLEFKCSFIKAEM